MQVRVANEVSRLQRYLHDAEVTVVPGPPVSMIQHAGDSAQVIVDKQLARSQRIKNQ